MCNACKYTRMPSLSVNIKKTGEIMLELIISFNSSISRQNKSYTRCHRPRRRLVSIAWHHATPPTDKLTRMCATISSLPEGSVQFPRPLSGINQMATTKRVIIGRWQTNNYDTVIFTEMMSFYDLDNQCVRCWHKLTAAPPVIPNCHRYITGQHNWALKALHCVIRWTTNSSCAINHCLNGK